MAYRVTTEPVNRARPAVAAARRHTDHSLDRSLVRNVTIASVALGCVCLAAAGVAVLGRDHDAGSLPNYVNSRKALKIAWAEPEQQAQFERNPMLAASQPKADSSGPKADTPIKTASRFDEAFGSLADNAPAIPPSKVPLPHANPQKLPRKLIAAAKLPAAPAPVEPVTTAALEAPAIAPPRRIPPPTMRAPHPNPHPASGEREKKGSNRR
jgi:hypothetical protein